MFLPIHMLNYPSHAPRFNPNLTSNHTTKPTIYLNISLEQNLTLNHLIFKPHLAGSKPPKIPFLPWENSRTPKLKNPIFMPTIPKLKMSLLFLWILQTSSNLPHIIQAEKSSKNNAKVKRRLTAVRRFIHFKKISKTKLSYLWFLLLLILFQYPFS